MLITTEFINLHSGKKYTKLAEPKNWIMKKRKRFAGTVVLHIYQRTTSRGLIFYSVKDFLVFFTVFSRYAEQHHVRILGLCLMFDHIHILIESDSQKTVSAFIHDYTTVFARMFNRRYGLKGPLFDRFGMADKRSDKAKRTALAYVYNNPVEARLCKSAEQWQWNFLAYARSRNPFSEPVVLRSASAGLRRAIRVVNDERNHRRHLTYGWLDRLFDGLTLAESKQLADYIVTAYSVIDHKRAIRFYGSYERMLLAFRSNTGSEYEIREDFDHHSGRAYIKMANFVAREKPFRNMGDLFKLPAEEKAVYANKLLACCGAAPYQVRKFLHIPVGHKSMKD